jgi:hypothetical protein
MDKLNTVHTSYARPRTYEIQPKSIEPIETQLPGESFRFVGLQETSGPTQSEQAEQSPVVSLLPSGTAKPSVFEEKALPKSFETTMVMLDEPNLPDSQVDSGPGLGSFGDWSRKAGGYDVAATSMRDLEKSYLLKFPYQNGEFSPKLKSELNDRYGDFRSSKERVHESIADFAKERGISMECPAEINSKALFGESSAEQMKASLVALADKFFDNPNASQNPLKAGLARKEANRFVDLLVQVQQEGSLPPQGSMGLTNAKVFQLVARNLGALAIQDEAACENILGDHGIRHLVGHNIQVCETVADKLSQTGTKISAKDRLILHQAMIMHDLGYSTQNVRGGFEHDGVQGQDAGHPVISGKYMRELTADAQDPVGLIFSAEDMQLMHRCVLYHDKDVNGEAGLDFKKTSQPTFDDRRANLESLTRLADNSHAFEDKLPELIYRHPKSLSILRLAKSAKELGMVEAQNSLIAALGQQINDRDDLSARDKKALSTAASQSVESDISYSVKRILGNDPTFGVNSAGKLEMSVQEAPIHHEVVSAFGQADHTLLGKYLEEIGGVRPSALKNGESTLHTPQIDFKLKLGTKKATNFTEFQTQLHQCFETDKPFKQWVVEENSLGRLSNALTAVLEKSAQLDDATLSRMVGQFVELGDGPKPRPELILALSQRADEVQAERKNLLSEYLETTKPTV